MAQITHNIPTEISQHEGRYSIRIYNDLSLLIVLFNIRTDASWATVDGGNSSQVAVRPGETVTAEVAFGANSLVAFRSCTITISDLRGNVIQEISVLQRGIDDVHSPEYSFVHFDGDSDVLPVSHVGDLSFQVTSEVVIDAIAKTDLEGNIIEQSTALIQQQGDLFHITPVFSDLSGCFRIALLSGGVIAALSDTVFSYTGSRYTSQLSYLNEEDGFSFDYCPESFVNRIRLPFYLHSPQYPQKRTVYERRDGRKKTLSAAISKEYELETDYLSADLHEKLLIALSHDEVYVEGKLLTLTSDYTIDWANTLLNDKGEETAKATCKLSENRTERNSNCGDLCTDPGQSFTVAPGTVIFEAA